VLPSLGIALRLVPKPTSVSHFTLVTEIVNYLRNTALENSPEELARDRFSSVGQLDLPTLNLGDEHLEIEENAIKVMGLWLLGAGVPFKYKPSPRALLDSAASPGGQRDLLACPSERIARCFPVKLALPCGAPAAPVGTEGRCSWLLPMPAAGNAKDSSVHLVRVVEQFLCIANSTSRFDREVEASRLLVQAAEREAETMGPRSIAQVRREKQQQQQQGEAGAADGGLPAALVNSRSSAVTVGSAQDLANLAAARNGITVAAVWACRWDGKLRWGMHKISSLSFVGESACAVGGQHQPLGSPRHGQTLHAGKSAADFLLVSLHHAGQCQLSAQAPHASEVPVQVRLRSLCGEPLSVTIAALDHVSADAHRNVNAGPLYVYSDTPEYSVEKVVNFGMRWNGKTQHIGLVIAPNEEVTVHLSAYFTQPGVFDLNRFKISARFSQSSNPQQALKQLMGQSLITVISP
jgi:hypothetical protein